MTSHHVTCHVTVITCLFIIQIIKRKRNIKLRKIDKRKRKILVFKHTVTKVTLLLDLQTIEKYIKTTNNIKAKEIEVPHLSQFKSYLKVIDISYLGEFTNTFINSDIVEDIIKKNHIFNNIALASKPHIIKVSSKLDMAIIWLDMWDIQNRSKTRGLINRCFNIGSYIVTIRGVNMNLGIPQYENY